MDLSSNSSSTCSSLGAAVAGRIRVKDTNILRSKSKPLEQSSAPDVGRRGGRGTSGSNTDVHEAGVELDMCRRRLQKLKPLVHRAIETVSTALWTIGKCQVLGGGGGDMSPW